MKERNLNGEIGPKIELLREESVNDGAPIGVYAGEQGEHLILEGRTVQGPTSTDP